MGSSRWESALAGTILGLMLVVALVVLLIAAWCLVRATNLVLRVLVRHPKSRALWLALALFFAFVALAAVELTPIFFGLAFAAGLVLVLVARGVDLYYSELFEEPPSLTGLTHDVLHEWWKEAA
jgi:hypothetical protein